MLIDFEVSGDPQSQGSLKSIRTKSGKNIVTSDNPKLKPWRQEAAFMAQLAMVGAGEHQANSGAIHLKLMFYFVKPKSTKKSVTQKLTRPDIDKCIRAALDSMTGICYRDDSQVVSVEAYKRFGERAYTRVIVEVVS